MTYFNESKCPIVHRVIKLWLGSQEASGDKKDYIVIIKSEIMREFA